MFISLYEPSVQVLRQQSWPKTMQGFGNFKGLARSAFDERYINLSACSNLTSSVIKLFGEIYKIKIGHFKSNKQF